MTRGMEAVVAKLCSALRALFPSWSCSEEQEAGQRGGKECLAAAPAQDKEAGSRKRSRGSVTALLQGPTYLL